MFNLYRLIMVLLLLMASNSPLAQEADDGAEAAAAETEAAEASDPTAEDGDDDIDDSDLDLQTYDEDEDDFVPTEEVPADQAIPFPTDI